MHAALKKTLTTAAVSAISVLVVVAALYAWNGAPAVAPVSLTQASDPARPFVVKLHARWCYICMSTTGMWSQIQSTYAGRVNLIVFDFTTEETTNTSRAEAHRLGLDAFFEENVGWTGAVVVLDGRTRQELAAIHGSRDFAEYRTAIDAALSGGGTRTGGSP